MTTPPERQALMEEAEATARRLITSMLHEEDITPFDSRYLTEMDTDQTVYLVAVQAVIAARLIEATAATFGADPLDVWQRLLWLRDSVDLP